VPALPTTASKRPRVKITTVTVYQNTVLVTREVTLPEAAGQIEVVVSPLPSATMQSSLYAEGSDAVRVLSARYRTRAIAEDNREEVRKLEGEIKVIQKGLAELEADLKGVVLNMAFNAKLEAFTAATLTTLTTLTEKGQILLSSYKTNAVDVQVWDRMPHAEAVGTIGTSFTMGATKLSEDPLYVRDEKNKNLLRWDVKVDPKQNGEKSLTIYHEFKMELDKNVAIGSFFSK